jgi:hypothetical protein
MVLYTLYTRIFGPGCRVGNLKPVLPDWLQFSIAPCCGKASLISSPTIDPTANCIYFGARLTQDR